MVKYGGGGGGGGGVKPKAKLSLWPITKDAENTVNQTKREPPRSAGKHERVIPDSHQQNMFS